METENRKCDVDFLEHYGIKGQRWGVRRFQNKDGSLTKAGKDRLDALSDKELQERLKRANLERRYASAMTRDTTRRKLFQLGENTFKTAAGVLGTTSDMAKVQNTKNIAKIASQGAKIGEHTSKGIGTAKRLKRYDLSAIPDKDLERLVSRAELEKRYVDEVKNKDLHDAIDTVNSVMGLTAAAVGITAAGFSIYKTIQDMKK